MPPEELLGELKGLRATAGTAVTGLSALREGTVELYGRGGGHLDDPLDLAPGHGASATAHRVKISAYRAGSDWCIMCDASGTDS